MNPNPYHAFLIKHRIYCERPSCYRYGALVENINGRDTVLCHEHAGRLKAVRQSDKIQDLQEAKDPNLTA